MSPTMPQEHPHPGLTIGSYRYAIARLLNCPYSFLFLLGSLFLCGSSSRGLCCDLLLTVQIHFHQIMHLHEHLLSLSNTYTTYARMRALLRMHVRSGKVLDARLVYRFACCVTVDYCANFAHQLILCTHTQAHVPASKEEEENRGRQTAHREEIESRQRTS